MSEGSEVEPSGEAGKGDGERLASIWQSALAAEGFDTTTPGLVAALECPRLDIRTGAAILLGRRGDVSAVPSLKRLLEDDISVVRVEAAMSLALLGDESGMPVLVETLREKFTTSAPVTAARYLAALGDPRGYGTVLEGLRSELAGIRLGAAMALKSFVSYQGSMIEGQKVDLLATLEESLEDPEPLVRRELLHKVALLYEAGAPALLSRVAESDPDPRVRQTAQDLLRQRSGAAASRDAQKGAAGPGRDDER
jgi:HEAT repeat protein